MEPQFQFDDTRPLTAARRRCYHLCRITPPAGRCGDYARLVTRMEDWWELRWVRLHAMVAPAGILAITLLLTYWRQGWEWPWPGSLDRASDLTDIGAVIYGVVAVAIERGVNMIFWALEERKKRRERNRAELEAEIQARVEAQAQAQGKLRAEGRAEGQAETAQRYEKWLAKVAEEKGIPLSELLPPPQEP